MTTAVRERPILFSAPMVNAILAGRKTQTRRIMKPQPAWRDVVDPSGITASGMWWLNQHGSGVHSQPSEAAFSETINRNAGIFCPHGEVGDILWVRETSRYTVAGKRGWAVVQYRADMQSRQMLCDGDGEGDPVSVGEIIPQSAVIADAPWKPSIFLPRWASRITLEITDVRVQRLQEISEADAEAEGVDFYSGVVTPRDLFSGLWESINGKGSWAANPWIWAISFRRVETTHA